MRTQKGVWMRKRRWGGREETFSAEVEAEDVVEDAVASADREELERLVEVHGGRVVDGDLAGDDDEDAAARRGLAVERLDLVARLAAQCLQALQHGLWAHVLLFAHCQHALGLLWCAGTEMKGEKMRSEGEGRGKKQT